MKAFALIKWWLRERSQHIDYVHLVMMALLLLSLGLQWRVLSPLQLHLTQQQQALSQIQHRLQTQQRQQQDLLTTTPQQTQTVQSLDQQFKAFLPTLSQRNTQLLKIQQLAVKQQLTLSQIDYQHNTTPILGLAQSQLRFTLKGDDHTLMTFTALLLAEHPNLAISRLSVEQTDNLSPSQQFNIEVQLWFRPEEAQ